MGLGTGNNNTGQHRVPAFQAWKGALVGGWNTAGQGVGRVGFLGTPVRGRDETRTGAQHRVVWCWGSSAECWGSEQKRMQGEAGLAEMT